jgi:hypothetical protein
VNPDDVPVRDDLTLADAWAEPTGRDPDEPGEWVCVRFAFQSADEVEARYKLTRSEAGLLYEMLRRAIDEIPAPH